VTPRRLSTRCRQSYEDVIRAALADRAFLSIALVSHSAVLLPTYLDRPAVAMLSRERERYTECEGNDDRAGAARRLWRTPPRRRCMYYEKQASIPASVVELINIPCSLARSVARHGVPFSLEINKPVGVTTPELNRNDNLHDVRQKSGAVFLSEKKISELESCEQSDWVPHSIIKSVILRSI